MKRLAQFWILGFVALGLPTTNYANDRESNAQERAPIVNWLLGDTNNPEITWASAPQLTDGPRPPEFPRFSPKSTAVSFGKEDAFARVANSQAISKLTFTNGDTITIEAWVRLDEIRNGQNQYIVGKGRTFAEGRYRENQNWAVRLRGVGREARVSFLFREANSHSNSNDQAYHRWTASSGFSAQSGWRFVAISYKFGAPNSIRGYVDGQPVNGQWDMGGPTSHPPFSDDSEIWIGSSMGDNPDSRFQGKIASIAIHGSPLSDSQIASQYELRIEPPNPDLSKVPDGHALVEIFENVGSRTQWPRQLGSPSDAFTIPAAALYGLPNKYLPTGERVARDGPLMIRISTLTQWGPGARKILMRSSGKSRVWRHGEPVFEAPGAPASSDGHASIRNPRKTQTPYPRARLGTQDSEMTWVSDGEPEPFIFETLIGMASGSTPVYELILAQSDKASGSWSYLNGDDHTSHPFTPADAWSFQQNQRADFDQLNAQRRAKAFARQAQRRARQLDRARNYIASLPPIEFPSVSEDLPPATTTIDQFLLAKIDAQHERELPGASEERRALGLLEKHCFECHGAKDKGGLRLSNRQDALEGGDSEAPAFVPGDPKASPLYERLNAEDEDDRMPPDGPGLTREEIDTLGAWITRGGLYPENPSPVELPDTLDDHTFLRRIYLDTVGVPPTPKEIAQFTQDTGPNRKPRLIERLLNDPRHADHWVAYWQDVLAENPNILKPTLNNTGPFRHWIHESMRDNKPMDQFVTELITFRKSPFEGGAAGFSIAAQNDSPMAAKAHILGTAFLGVEMKCARCHDAPYHESKQKDLFSIAAMLEGQPLTVPESSSVPAAFFEQERDHEPLVQVSLKPGEPIEPNWPFQDLVPNANPSVAFDSPAARLAWQITRPENRRFAQVMANRIWKRYFGEGIVEPAHDWQGAEASHPKLLDYLARRFVSSGYDLRALSKEILQSDAYQRQARPQPANLAAARYFEAPLKRRFSAEQLLDTLYATTGAPRFSEELTLDVEGHRRTKDFINFGFPTRAWRLASPSTERDRPSLALPHINAQINLMKTFGWRESRAEPVTDRDAPISALQSGVLANGLLSVWLTRLSDFNPLTQLAVEAKNVDALIDRLFLRLITRLPTPREHATLRDLLKSGFRERHTAEAREFQLKPWIPDVREVSWSNHLSPGANTYAAQEEQEAKRGPTPTRALDDDWRTRMEDAVWSLINLPEFQFIP